ncbi:DUF4136 domain-containing protein [Novosphingobium sp. KCTC 2891]|uniref:DUF4136 domain-containing protein n=1 Tax=Novosphingobium sp. KCTC 2891 TaxID=2989730 RepID=UPI00222188E4|nr:DUF4136 domain-containing protein [Novosphingobium sp. KCTC 2891]MCW1382385.1 DUF4136 domain-containing protein [Novosphingobium sp. KCTC 2891]
MRRLLPLLAFLAAAPALAAPVEVTRFHTPDTIAILGKGAVFVTGAPGTDPASLENRVWLDAVARELAAQGWGFATAGAADRVIEVRVERQTLRRDRQRGPVSVGVGGSTGGWHSGVGLGVGFDLGGRPKDLVATRLSVVIRDRLTGRALWEGRAENTEKAGGKLASAEPAARRMAHALFAGFPGTSGATITVK